MGTILFKPNQAFGEGLFPLYLCGLKIKISVWIFGGNGVPTWTEYIALTTRSPEGGFVL